MRKTVLERLKSKPVWVAALAQVLLVIALCNPNLANEIKLVGGAIIEIATLFGILNNPTDKENF